MSEIETINDSILKELKNEILDAIDEAEHSMMKLDKGHPSIYLFLVEIDTYKCVLDMIDKRIQKGSMKNERS